MSSLQRNWGICIGCIGLMIAAFAGMDQHTTNAQSTAGANIGTRVGAQDSGEGTQGNNYLLMSSLNTEEGQQLTVIDVKTKAICVYLIRRGSGKIKLLSARNGRWDFQIDEFNSDTPTPREIQRLTER